jgi:preprotein translocase subunit SecA
MNKQRTAIYDKRRNALYGDRLSLDISNMMFDITESLVDEFQELRDVEGFKMELIKMLGINVDYDEPTFLGAKKEEIVEETFKKVTKNYKHKCENIADSVYPVIKDVYENQSTRYSNIAIPITDGVKTRNIITNLEEAYKSKGKSVILSTEKSITLSIIDEIWKEHLREMDELKQSVQNASYEQKDPLLIYKFESFELFQQLLGKINKDIMSFLVLGDLPENKEVRAESNLKPAGMDFSQLEESKEEARSKFGNPTQQRSQKAQQPIKKEKKVGRNDPCPCGSGKKYKHCHGQLGQD